MQKYSIYSTIYRFYFIFLNFSTKNWTRLFLPSKTCVLTFWGGFWCIKRNLITEKWFKSHWVNCRVFMSGWISRKIFLKSKSSFKLKICCWIFRMESYQNQLNVKNSFKKKLKLQNLTFRCSNWKVPLKNQLLRSFWSKFQSLWRKMAEKSR